MPIIITPDSEESLALAKWEQFPGKYATQEQVGNPYRFRPYPQMLYLATVREDGRIVCQEDAPVITRPGKDGEDEYAFRLKLWDQRQKATQRVVQSDSERAQAEAVGWRASAAEAMAYQESLQQAMAQAAAEANFAAGKMSSKAQADRRQREAASDKHLTE